jgi:AcrR family transcriptional regulator
MAASTGKKLRRNKILEAARQCLARFGFDKMTLDDVGNMVGLNKASLYYYYPSKEELVIDVLVTESGEYLEALREKVESYTDCKQRIQTYLVERFRIYQRVANLHNISRATLRQMRPAFRDLCSQFKADEIRFVGSILSYCVKQGAIRSCDTGRVAGSILAVAEAYKLEVIENPDIPPDGPVDYSSIEDDVVFTVSLIIEGLRP